MSTLYSLIRIPLKQHLHNRYEYHYLIRVKTEKYGEGTWNDDGSIEGKVPQLSRTINEEE